MLSLTDRDAVTAALTDPALDADLRALIGLRIWQVDTDRRRPLKNILQIVVVQPGDDAETIHDAVGFPICWDQAEQPGWEWMNDHGSWFELAYVLTDAFGMLVFVADHPDTNHTLRFNCLGIANRPPAADRPEPTADRRPTIHPTPALRHSARGLFLCLKGPTRCFHSPMFSRSPVRWGTPT